MVGFSHGSAQILTKRKVNLPPLAIAAASDRWWEVGLGWKCNSDAIGQIIHVWQRNLIAVVQFIVRVWKKKWSQVTILVYKNNLVGKSVYVPLYWNKPTESRRQHRPQCRKQRRRMTDKVSDTFIDSLIRVLLHSSFQRTTASSFFKWIFVGYWFCVKVWIRIL